MRINLYACVLNCLLTMSGILFGNNLLSQTTDTIPTIILPLSHEDLSLYDFASVRMETEKTEKPPADIIKRTFQPVKKIFAKDELPFADSVQSVWFKFTIRNNDTSDASLALVFPGSVNKAVLYKKEGEEIVFVGKTGWVIAVIKRTVPDEEGRIDIILKAHSQLNCFLQIPRTGFLFCPKAPALENVAHADMKMYSRVKKVRRPELLWYHFFTGIFFMFFVFGFIKYLVLGKDRAYLYYSLMGLFSALLTVAAAEYPPFELPSFENLRGIELSDLVGVLAYIMQALFILEILQLKTKYPGITRIIKWYLFAKLLLYITNTTLWLAITNSIPLNVSLKTASSFKWIETYDAFFYLILMAFWVVYLARMRKGFYRFIFLGALTIFIAYALIFAVRFFHLGYLLPAWFGGEERASSGHLMQIALVIDMLFYFTGLAHRERQVERDKIKFQEESIKQLEANKKFQEQFTAELEQQVVERTAEVVEEKAEVEKQKAKSDELLLNILPSEVAEELKEKGYTTAKAFDEVTVLFSDIKGFTNVAEKMTAQQLVKEIDTYFSAFDNIILKYGLEKIKTIGDAYIAAGGLPENNSATAQNVIEAAIAMQQEVEKLKGERVTFNKPYFELRIGIHTGPVVAGVVGIKKFQYDIWGDTVNLAARMEQSGIPGKINISQHTYDAVKDQFNCVHRGKIEAKNKGEIDMYFVEVNNQA